jgi:uncharacterized protein (DUF983 family)
MINDGIRLAIETPCSGRVFTAFLTSGELAMACGISSAQKHDGPTRIAIKRFRVCLSVFVTLRLCGESLFV